MLLLYSPLKQKRILRHNIRATYNCDSSVNDSTGNESMKIFQSTPVNLNSEKYKHYNNDDNSSIWATTFFNGVLKPLSDNSNSLASLEFPQCKNKTDGTTLNSTISNNSLYSTNQSQRNIEHISKKRAHISSDIFSGFDSIDIPAKSKIVDGKEFCDTVNLTDAYTINSSYENTEDVHQSPNSNSSDYSNATSISEFIGFDIISPSPCKVQIRKSKRVTKSNLLVPELRVDLIETINEDFQNTQPSVDLGSINSHTLDLLSPSPCKVYRRKTKRYTTACATISVAPKEDSSSNRQSTNTDNLVNNTSNPVNLLSPSPYKVQIRRSSRITTTSNKTTPIENISDNSFKIIQDKDLSDIECVSLENITTRRKTNSLNKDTNELIVCPTEKPPDDCIPTDKANIVFQKLRKNVVFELSSDCSIELNDSSKQENIELHAGKWRKSLVAWRRNHNSGKL